MVRRGRRAGAWSPPMVAAMARSLTREGRREAGRLTALAERARRINEAGYAADLDQSSAATAAAAATVEAASLYWVAAPNLTQTTVVAGTGKPRTTRTNDAAGRGDPADSGVTVIDLHPHRRRLITPDKPDDDGGPRRRLTTRHVVRGHWTHQPHGPAKSLRRLQWVDDYIRGPQDAPLSTRTHVWAWR